MSNESRIRYLERLLHEARDDVSSVLADMLQFAGYPKYDAVIDKHQKLLKEIDDALRDRLGGPGWSASGVHDIAHKPADADCPHSALDGCQCFKDGRLVKGGNAP